MDQKKINAIMDEMKERIKGNQMDLLQDLMSIYAQSKAEKAEALEQSEENTNFTMLDQVDCIVDWSSFHTAVLMELLESQALTINAMQKDITAMKDAYFGQNFDSGNFPDDDDDTTLN